ncbi:flagellar filament capping protein FliD [Neobacillus novalis]|uniref:flagellar filament capping protein FliD n=1 Tax=Neobacillus novalis TaxID=220687 RepID=UPI000824E987|nr:flagellar filament capping protein FliD [Neobacillus novalis]
MATSSITRITGMATGMDTDSIVKKLMDVEKIPLNKLKQQQQKQTWLSDAYRQWNKDLLSFQSNTLFNMKLSSAYNTFDVTSSLSNSISGTATSSAIAGTYTVAVNRIAESATFTGNKVQLDPSKPLGDGTDSVLTTIKIKDNNDSTKTIDIDIKNSDTLNDVISKFNSAKDSSGKSLGLQAIYDGKLQQFILKTKATGDETKIDFGQTSQEGQDFFKNILGFEELSKSGKNADITFNGNQITSLSSNNVTIMGISLTLKSPTLDAAGNPLTSTINVSQNIDAEVKNIQDFVNKYNDLLDKLNKALDEQFYKDYPPLTDDQRKDLSEKQIEQWEEKAKSGLLRRDSILTDMMNKLRSAMGAIVSNGSTYNSLGSIGISSKSYQDRGKLYIDEKKLREAIQADPDGVRTLFSQIGDTDKGTNGVVQRLSDVMTQGIKDLTKKAGVTGSSLYDQSVIGKLLANIQKDITRQNSRMFDKENQYYKQFAAMEAAVNKFNSQGSWLYSQFNSGQ